MSQPAPAMAAVTSAPPRAPAARTRLARAIAARPAAWVLLGYFALTMLLWGRFVVDGFGSHIVAINDYDTSGFMWFYAWWPHALLHGQDPVYTNAVLVPDGYNLAWATSLPGLSLVLAPLTLAFGPVATFNVVALLAPTLSAWTAFLLCHHVTRTLWPSFVGGFVFGFSSYVVVELQGLHHLAFVALVPVVVLLVVRRIDGSLGERRFVVLVALALAAQLLVSTEV